MYDDDDDSVDEDENEEDRQDVTELESHSDLLSPGWNLWKNRQWKEIGRAHV